MFSDLPLQAAQLATSAAARLFDAFRPATKHQYAQLWLDFQAFKLAAGLPFSQVAFMEFLAQNGQSPANIANYMAALRAYHIINNLPTAPFKDEHIQFFQRSLKLQAPLKPSKRSLLTIDILTKIIQCQNLPFPFIFTPLYLLALFSNILPHFTISFDKTRQLSCGNIIIQPQGAVVLVKWSKTIQNRKDVATVSIPALGNPYYTLYMH